MKHANPWPVNKKLTDHMLMRQLQHRAKGMTKAETWFFENFLMKTQVKWNKQCAWGFRLFDFWNHRLGVAIEVDGPEHNEETDLIEDFKEWERSRIITIRVRNFNRDDATYCMEKLPLVEPWDARRFAAGLSRVPPKLMPYPLPKVKKTVKCVHTFSFVEVTFKDGTRHVKETCSVCNFTNRFISRSSFEQMKAQQTPGLFL